MIKPFFGSTRIIWLLCQLLALRQTLRQSYKYGTQIMEKTLTIISFCLQAFVCHEVPLQLLNSTWE